MVCVGGVAVAGHLAVDPRAARPSVLEFLQHQHAGTLAYDEAVALRVERP